MLRLPSAIVLVCLLAGFSLADHKTGEIQFTGPMKEKIKASAGEKLKLTVEFKQFELNGRSAVSVNGNIKNTASTKMYYSYNIAFLDKNKNLIGCQNFVLDIEAGKTSPAGTFLFLPRDEIGRIYYYSIAFYESDMPIGK